MHAGASILPLASISTGTSNMNGHHDRTFILLMTSIMKALSPQPNENPCARKATRKSLPLHSPSVTVLIPSTQYLRRWSDDILLKDERTQYLKKTDERSTYSGITGRLRFMMDDHFTVRDEVQARLDYNKAKRKAEMIECEHDKNNTRVDNGATENY